MKRTCASLTLFVALLFLAGCGGTAATATTSNGSTSTTAAGGKICQSVAKVNQSLAQLANVGENTTVGEVKAIQQKLTPALTTLAGLPLPSGNASGAVKNLKAANDQLAAAIKDLPDSATVGQVGPRFQALKGNVSQAQSALAQVSSTLKCSS